MGSSRLSNILRHGNLLGSQKDGTEAQTADHDKAVRQWGVRKAEPRAKGSSSDDEDANLQHICPSSISYAHLVFQRTIIATGDSFKDFPRWIASARMAGAEMPGPYGERVSKQLTEAMAMRETQITTNLSYTADSFCLKQDGRGESLANTAAGVVLWKWPRGIPKSPLPHGVRCLGIGDNPPWIGRRLLAISDLQANHSSDAKASAAEEAMAMNTRDTDDGYMHMQKILHHYVADNAADAQEVGPKLRTQHRFSNLAFLSQGAFHSALLVLKTTLGCDPEIDEVDKLLVSSKEPPSLARFLTQSTRLAAKFGEKQAHDHVQALTHLGWRPQRADSKKKPYGRFAWRLSQCFETLAEEADDASQAVRRAAAVYLLKALSGANTNRLVLGGMLADLSHEHSMWSRGYDKDNLDSTSVMHRAEKFINRLNLLFVKGLILTQAASDTFTGQVLKFLSEANKLTNKVVVAAAEVVLDTLAKVTIAIAFPSRKLF